MTTKPAQFTPGTCQCRWSGAVNFVMCPLHTAAPAMYEALLELVICPAFNGQVFEKDKESHRAWTLARNAIAQVEGR